MLTFRRLITFVVPSSILGLSWFWWRWKNKTSESEEDMESIGETNIVDSVDVKHIPEENYSIDKLDSDKLFISDTVVVEEKMEALVINEQTCNNEDSVEILNDFQETITLEKQESKKSEDESGIDVDDDLSNEDNSSIVTSAEHETSSDDLPCGKAPISQLSVECVEEDIVSEDLSPVQCNAPSGKRNRNQSRSSCGDSAICDDYSSDALSITGSESAVKTSESEAFASESQPEASMTEEQRIKKFQQDAKTYRDWYGSNLCSNDYKERPDKPRHWGSLPVSDTDSDTECILKRTAKIGSVSLDKLSIELSEELTKLKSPSEKYSSKSSRNTPKHNRRRNRRSESRTPKKSPTKPSPHPKKSESRRSRKRSSATPKKDLDKSWRNLDTKKPEKLVIDPNAKRVTVEYEFPDDMCGRLIGKSGRHISEFKESTGVDICIECELHGKNRIVSMTGVLSQIQSAERQLNEKFNDSLKLVSYPDISDAEKEVSVVTLPEDNVFNVVVTAIIDVGNFFLQMCNREVEERLTQLQTDLYGCYLSPRQKYLYKDNDLPKVDEYCVSFVDNLWCRLKILEVNPETRMVDAFFIDYGGNVNLSVDIVWKIRPDLLQIPAQATLCCLNNAIPAAGETEFSYEANELFYQLVGAKAMQASVLSYNEDVPIVQLSYFDEERGEIFSVLEQMQAWGLVQDDSIPAQLSESSLDDESVQTDSSREDYMQQLHEDGVQLVDSLLDSSAPQFVYAS